MKKIKIFLFSFIFIFASLVAIGFYAFSPNVSYGVVGTDLCTINDPRPECNQDIIIDPAPTNQDGCPDGSEYRVSTDSCLEATGTLTSPNCTIDAGESSCPTTLTWKVNDRVTGSSNIGYVDDKTTLFHNQPFIVGTGNDVLNKPYTIKGGIDTTFSLKYINEEIKTITVKPTCAAGSSWDGSKCLAATVTSFTYTDCIIPAPIYGINTCDTTISWNVNNALYDSQLKIDGAASGYSGNQKTITYNNIAKNVGKTFSLSYAGKNLGSITVNPVYGDFNAGCLVPVWGASCSPWLNWSVYNSVSTSIPVITATINGAENTTITSGISSPSLQPFVDSTRPLNYGVGNTSRNYYLYYKGIEIGVASVAPGCNNSISAWNNDLHMCSPATLTVSSCEIPIKGTSNRCPMNWKLHWWTNNIPAPISNTMTNVPLAITTPTNGSLYSKLGYTNIKDSINSSGDINGSYYMPSPGTRNFFAYYDSKEMSEMSATSYCKAGSAWNGVICSPATLTVTPSCIIGLNQSTCPVDINFNLNIYHWEGDQTNAIGNDVTSVTTPTNINVPWVQHLYFDHNCSAWSYAWSLDGVDCGYLEIVREGTATYNVKYGDTPFYLYNNFVSVENGRNYSAEGLHLMGTATATATCGKSNGVQLAWDGNKCVVPTGTISASCYIQSGASSCKPTLTWNTENPKTGITSVVKIKESVYILGVQIPLVYNYTEITTGNSGTITANYDLSNSESKTFQLYHNGELLSETTVTAVVSEVTLSLINKTSAIPVPIPVSEGNFTKRVSNSLLNFFGLRTTSFVPVSTPMQIHWEAKGLDINTISCTMPDGSKVTNSLYGDYPEGENSSIPSPNSTTTYSVTCVDGQ